MHRIIITLFVLGSLLACLAVPGARAVPREDILALMNQVSAANLNATLLHFEDYGTRFCASANAWAVAQDLRSRMVALGWETGLQEFTFEHDTLGVVTSWNVVARRAGLAPYPDGATVILGAHWDTVNEQPGGSYDDPEAPAPGVGDNGTGVACLLEIARIVKDYSFYQNVEIVFFGAEETHLEGSKAYVAQHNALDSNIAGVLNVDTIGFDTDALWDFAIVSDDQSRWFKNWILGYVSDYSPELTPIVWEIPGGWSNSDAYSFWQNHPADPAVSIWEGRPDIPGEHAPYGHTALDTYENSISDYGIFLRAMTRFVFASFCAYGNLGDKLTDVADLPGSDAALAIHPNPFRDRATIRFASEQGNTGARLSIYDLQGRRVRSLPLAGGESVVWDGRDAEGGRLSSGVYFVRADGRPDLDSQRVVLLR